MPVSLGRHNPGFLAEALKGYGSGDVWRTQLQQTTASSTAPNPTPLDPKQCLRCSHIRGDEPFRPSGLKNIPSSSEEARIQEMWEGCGCDTMHRAAATPDEYQRAGHAFILYSAHIHAIESDPVPQFSTLTNNSLILDCPHTEHIHFQMSLLQEENKKRFPFFQNYRWKWKRFRLERFQIDHLAWRKKTQQNVQTGFLDWL